MDIKRKKRLQAGIVFLVLGISLYFFLPYYLEPLANGLIGGGIGILIVNLIWK